MSENKLVEGKCIRISGIELESSIEPTRVDRVRFKTDNGDITWKPMRTETTILNTDGFKVRRTQHKPTYIKNLPKIVFDIRDRLKDNENVSVKADYIGWSSPDGNKFHIFDDKQIDEMKLIEPKNVDEE